MSGTFAAMLVAVIPPVVIVALLRLSDRVERNRDARLALQIELTDAIHREMGAVVAPVVEKRRSGGWMVHMTAPLHDQEVVTTLLSVTEQVFARNDIHAVEIAFAGRQDSAGALEAPRSAWKRGVERRVPIVAGAR